MSANLTNDRFRIGPWLVEPTKNQLLFGEQRRRLLPRSMKMLVYLAEHHDAVVDSEELISVLWGEHYVGENPLYKHVALIRKALQLNEQKVNYIQTVPKRGYRLVADVSFPDDYVRSTAHTIASWSSGSPYRGLQAFQFEHAPIFYGREKMVQRVVNALEKKAHSNTAFVLLLGGSGSGKSSLVRAGVIPKLCSATAPPRIKSQFRGYVKPSDSPQHLIMALAKAIAFSGLITGANDALTEELANLLPGSSEDLQSRIATFRSVGELNEKRLTVFVDQFEELFTLRVITHKQRIRFANALRTLSGLSFVNVIVAMRNDYYPRCVELESIIQLKQDGGQVDMTAPTQTEVGQMIRLPARAAGLMFEEDSQTNERLEDLLRDDAIDNPASLPLLEFALDTLYEKRSGDGLLTLQAYESLGGLAGALAVRAEATYFDLSDQAKVAAPKVFGTLIDINAFTGQRTKNLQIWKKIDDATDEVITQFVNRRLFISTLSKQGERVVSVAHEALIAHWPRLGAWLDTNEDMLRIRNRLENAATRWVDEAKRDDLLLPVGRRLQEAESLESSENIKMSVLARDYLRKSKTRANKRKAFRLGGMAAVVLTSIMTGIAAFYATQSRDEARLRQAQAEDLLGFMVGDLRNQLVTLGRLDILDDVGEKAQAYFSSLDLHTLSEESLLNQAKTLEQIGQVRLDQGSIESALDAFSSALNVNKKVRESRSDNTDALFALGNSHYWVGYAHWKLNQVDQTELHWTSYFNAAEQLVAINPDNPSWQMELSYAYNNLGTLAQERNDAEYALEMFENSVATKEKLIALDPGNKTTRVELADSLSWLASTMESQGRYAEALNYFARMLEVVRSVLNTGKPHVRDKYRLSLAHQHLSRVYDATGKFSRALEHLKKAVEINTELTRIDQTNRVWQRDHAYLAMKLGQLLTYSDVPQNAERYFKVAAEEFDALTELDAQNSEWWRLRITNQISYAWWLAKMGYAELSENTVTSALDDFSDETLRNKQSNRETRWLARAHLLAYKLLSQKHRKADIKKHLMALRSLNDTLSKPIEDPRNLFIAYKVALATGNKERATILAKTLYQTGFRKAEFIQACTTNQMCPMHEINQQPTSGE